LLVTPRKGRCCLYLALYCFLELGVEFVMSKLHFLKVAVNTVALQLATDVELQEIVRRFHCHFITIYRIQQNVYLFGELQPVSLIVIDRPQKITAKVLEGLLDFNFM
jgi:hypothetical protein